MDLSIGKGIPNPINGVIKAIKRILTHLSGFRIWLPMDKSIGVSYRFCRSLSTVSEPLQGQPPIVISSVAMKHNLYGEKICYKS